MSPQFSRESLAGRIAGAFRLYRLHLLASLLVFMTSGYFCNTRPGWNVNSQFALACAIAEQGTFRNLGEILVTQDVLSKELVLGLLKERDQVIGVCPDCGEKYNVSNAYLPEAKCLQDGASLVKFDAENASISVSATVNPDGEGGPDSPIGMEMARIQSTWVHPKSCP